jgi:hypothetical protein
VALGLTDSDDVRAGLKNGLPIAGQSLSQDGFSIRNSIGYVAGAPRPGLAKRLAKHLQSQPVIDALVAAGALDPGTPGASATIAWPGVVAENERAVAELNSIFLD